MLRLSLLTLFLVVTGSLSAYDLGTHARITLAAFQQSSLTPDPAKLANLGLPSLKYTLLGDFYYDVEGGQGRRRETYRFDYDHDKFPDATLSRNINGWLMRGAVREDDGGRVVYLNLFRRGERPPFDDPDDNSFNRFCNHFFSPLYADSQHAFGALTDSAASALCFFLPPYDTRASAPVWASGSVGPFGFYSEDLTRRNHFSVYDAREAMWRALTGYDKTLATKVAANGVERKAYWATTFRALGDILHLNQDMAQPQHTRNESHGVYSHYEDYIDSRARGNAYVETIGRQKTVRPSPPLNYFGYVTPRFSQYGKYWSTGTGNASLTGRGLADYSSRGFFTPAHNFGDTAYPSPSSNEADYVSETAVDLYGRKVEYLKGPVRDFYTGSQDTIRMTMRSAWAESLGDFHFVNLEVFDDHANLLIPRAVGYSAGLLDYFFNGRLEISLPAEGAYAVVDHSAGGGTQGFTQVLMNLKNVTPPLMEDGSPYPQNMIGGQAVAVVKFHRNTCYKPDLTGEYAGDFNKVMSCRENASAYPLDHDDSSERIVVSKKVALSLDAGATTPIKFDFSNDPIPLDTSDLYLQVVYRGPLGPDAGSAEQDVVVVGTKDISEPTYFSYFNASDYIAIAGKVHLRSDLVDNQVLLPLVRPTQCVTGSYPNLHLVDGCLAPFSLSMQLSFADLSDPTVRVVDLPSKRFFRFVFLSDGAPAPTGNRRGAAQGSPVRLRMVMTGRQPLTLLNQQSICLPLDPFDVKPGQNQLYFDSLIYDSTQTVKLRGIAGYYQVSCIIDGDGSAPGSPDDRDTAMSDLKDAEIQPLAVTIKGAFTGN